MHLTFLFSAFRSSVLKPNLEKCKKELYKFFGGQNNSIVMILLTKQYTDENCKFIKFARIFTYERQFGKRKSMLFLTILSKKKIHSVGGKNIILLTILLNILFCGEKKLLLSILCKEKLFWGKILFSRIRNSFFFFKIVRFLQEYDEFQTAPRFQKKNSNYHSHIYCALIKGDF